MANDDLLNHALQLVRSGQFELARQHYLEFVHRHPSHAGGWLALARLLRHMNRVDESIAAFDRSLVADPRQPDALIELAGLVAPRGQNQAAIMLAQRALSQQPERREFWVELAHHHLDAGQFDAAINALQEVLRRGLGPPRSSAEIIAAIGQVMIRQQRFEEAIDQYLAALSVDPHCPLAESGLVAVYTRLARIKAALGVIDRKLKRTFVDPASQSQRLFLLNYLDDITPDELAKQHFEWGRRWCALMPKPAIFAAIDPSRRVRIGYVSADFKQHSVAYFIEPVLAGHDRHKFEIYCYSSTSPPDLVTQRLAGLTDVWRDVTDLDDAAVHRQVMNDRIDILVDLSGHTADNRLGVFARRGAPIQISWLGYPHSTGLPTMDFRIGDAISDPPGPADLLASEKLIRLPRRFLCYRPATASLDDRAAFVPPSETTRYITFGSFNHVAKLSPQTISTWARILREVPASRLVLKAHGLGAPTTAHHIKAEFLLHGIPNERLTLTGGTADHSNHMAAYRQIDIALDPFPYNGTTTTIDALWMSVPVITLAGDRHAARVGASILTAAGHPELIAGNIDDYVALARSVANNTPLLHTLHNHLRRDLIGSPLMDERSFVHDLESAYLDVCQTTDQPAAGHPAPNPTAKKS